MQSMDKQVREVLDALNIAYRYDHFRQSEAVPPPFAVYRRVAADPFAADGIAYHRNQHVDVELYADTPEDMAEFMERLETLLGTAGIYAKCTADTVYIESEDFYESLYEI